MRAADGPPQECHGSDEEAAQGMAAGSKEAGRAALGPAEGVGGLREVAVRGCHFEVSWLHGRWSDLLHDESQAFDGMGAVMRRPQEVYAR